MFDGLNKIFKNYEEFGSGEKKLNPGRSALLAIPEMSKPTKNFMAKKSINEKHRLEV